MIYGVGGGIILVPTIYFFLRQLGFADSICMEIAVGTSLLNVFATMLTAAIKHYHSGTILWNVLRRLTPFVILGTLVGVALSHIFDGHILKDIFIVFLAVILIHSFFNKSFHTSWKLKDFTLPSFFSIAPLGFVVGAFSVLVGIGGGIMMIPYFRHYKMPMLQVTAVTSSIGPVLALIGSIGYFFMHLASTPPYSIGAINLPIFVTLFAGSWLGIQYAGTFNTNISDSFRAKTYPILIALMLGLMLA